MGLQSFMESRRQFLQSILFGAVTFAAAGLFAGDIVLTPRQTEGPFYPDKLPPDTDNDLVQINDSPLSAAGEVINLSGHVLDPRGKPVRDTVVEIWQVDNNGVYIHTRSPNQDRHDANFQGFGRCVTGPSGEYSFRTIQPRPYTFGVTRAPHIHFIIKKGDKRMLTTQMYIKGHPLNDRDIVLQGIPEKAARESVIVSLHPLKGSRSGEFGAVFDIVLGRMPEDPEEDIFKNQDGRPMQK